MSTIIISDRGVEAEEWIPAGELEAEGHLERTTIDESLFAYWNDIVKVEQTAKFKDLVEYLRVMDVETQEHLSEIVQTDISAFLAEASKPYIPDGDDKDPMWGLAIGKIFTLEAPEKDSKWPSMSLLNPPSLSSFFDLSGVSNETDNWSVSMTPINKLMGLQLLLKETATLDVSAILPIECVRLKVSDVTFGELISAIFYDLGFYGSPKERDEMAEELNETMEEIHNMTDEERKTNLVPLDDVIKKMDDILDDSRKTKLSLVKNEQE